MRRFLQADAVDRRDTLHFPASAGARVVADATHSQTGAAPSTSRTNAPKSNHLVILPGLSHFAMLQDPAAFNYAVLEFLK